MYLTETDIITSSGKYPDRANSDELTDEVRANIQDLLARVNGLLAEVEIAPAVSGGFRPRKVNEALRKKGAAPKSLHMSGRAVDLNDPVGALKFKIIMNPQLLAKYGLWMEHYESTPGWCHLDTGTRPDRPVRIFRP
jgi:uncharacterized protein YcbK (DUF882 family)